MDESVHALAAAALADGVKRLALSCRAIESVEFTVTMPQGGSVTVAARGLALCKHASRRAWRVGHAGRGRSAARGRGGPRRQKNAAPRREERGPVPPVEHDGAPQLSKLEKSKLRLKRKWRTRRLVALAVLYYGTTLRRWVRAARTRLAAVRDGADGSSQDVELPAASVLGARCCSEVAASEQAAQRPRRAAAAELTTASETPRVPSRASEAGSIVTVYCEPQLIVAVDPKAVERRHLDVRGIVEAYLQTRIAEAVLRVCDLEVHDHVCYVVAPTPEATDRIYPPTPGDENSLRVLATTGHFRTRPGAPPVHLRIALANTDAGDSILQKWPLPTPGQHG